MTTGVHRLIVELAPGYPGDHEFTLRVTPEYEDELSELLRENGLYGGRILEHSDSATLLAIMSVAVGAHGALTRLADVLIAFIKRNESKEISLRPHTAEYNIKGYSRGDVEWIIEKIANLQAERDGQSMQLRNTEAPEE
jgi:hypothetical protein